jgi:ligand-binding sensor domain-containing protein
VQFTVAAAMVLAIGLNADRLVESFRRRIPHEGWTRFRPPHETAALLVEGTKLWSGGRDGLSVFDWERSALLELPKGTPSLERVRSLMLDRNGALWVGHGGGVERRGGSAWLHLDAQVGAVEVVLERRNGEIWAGGEKGLARLEGGSFRMVRDSSALGIEGVFALLEDSSGAMWAGSADPVHGGLVRLAGDGIWQDFTHHPGLAHPSVSSIFEDREGGLWFATGFGKRGGACRLRDAQWKCLGKKDGLTSDRARTVFEDSGGRFWIGSETEGLAVESGKGWRILTPDNGMTGWEVKRIAETPNGVFWLGTEDGVTMIRPDAPELRGGVAR